MARIRTIKPEFFTSSDIVSLTPLARVFYVALWCEADREGLLSWNENTMKMRYLPGDDVYVSDIADELEEAGLIVFYDGEDGKTYVEIPTFKEHQVINNRESESAIAGRVKAASKRVKAEGRKEGKGREGTKDKEANASVASGQTLPEDDPDSVAKEVTLKCPIGLIVNAYHDLMPLNPRVRVLSDARKRTIAARWRQASKLDAQPFGYSDEESGVAAWKKFFEICSYSDFLTGKAKARPGQPPFIADIDFLMSPHGFASALENKYHREVQS